MKNIDVTGKGLDWGLGLGKKRALRDHMGSKSEVFVCINRGGYNAYKEQQFTLVFRFSPEAVKKIAPRSSYSNAALVDELHRVYFREDRAGTGKKLSNTSTNGKNREIKFTIKAEDKKIFDKVVGSYLLLFDNERGYYYIDWEQKLVDDFNT